MLPALLYQMASRRLYVGLLITDHRAEERSVAVAFYGGLGDLARVVGVGEVLAQAISYEDYPYKAGYLGATPGGGWILLSPLRPRQASSSQLAQDGCLTVPRLSPLSHSRRRLYAELVRAGLSRRAALIRLLYRGRCIGPIRGRFLWSARVRR